MIETLIYLSAAAIGVLAALTELLSRYRDDPWVAATSVSALAYLAFNGAVAALTLFLIRRVYPIHELVAGRPTMDLGEVVTEVLVAGAASMAVMRSSFFTARVAGQDVEIGLAGIIQIFKNTIDRDVDRLRAGPRATEVAAAMREVSFTRAYKPLTSMSLNLLQNVSADERARIEQQVEALANQTGRTDAGKALELGLILAGTVGFRVLKAAKDNLGNSISSDISRKDLAARAVETLPFNTIMQELPNTCLALATNLPEEAQAQLAEQIDLLNQTQMSPRVKAVNVSLLLAHEVGEEVFKAAMELLQPPEVGAAAASGQD